MKLASLSVEGVRNLTSVSLESLARVNIFFGANGAGKTSLLEAIYLLGMARSFRGVQLQPVIQRKIAACTVFGRVETAAQSITAIGVKRSRSGQFRLRIAGQDEKSLARLAETLPLQLISSTAYSLLEGGPKPRRQFLDWGVFHVEHSFYAAWRRVQRSLKQRNRVLRSGRASPAALAPWNQELVEASAVVDSARAAYFHDFSIEFFSLLQQLLDLTDITLDYFRGWDHGCELASLLHEGEERDSRRGLTHYGPHRADLRLRVAGIDAGQVLSRGQQKLVVCALRLAQCRLLLRETEKKCVLLIDDLPAEIDAEHQRRLCAVLDSLDVQLFLTCVSPDPLLLSSWQQSGQPKLFYVEDGEVCESSKPPSVARQSVLGTAGETTD